MFWRCLGRTVRISGLDICRAENGARDGAPDAQTGESDRLPFEWCRTLESMTLILTFNQLFTDPPPHKASVK